MSLISNRQGVFKIRRRLQDILYKNWHNRSRTISPAEMEGGCLVFSPHFDDETLGCGGLILQKRRVGAQVKIVFMTDGGRSHSQWMPEGELKQLRRSESAAAADVLGLEPGQIEFLGYPETLLEQHREEAIQDVRRVLRREHPQQVFIPYSGEPALWSMDHILTTQIVLQALSQEGMDADIYEYPIWFWLHWPWVGLPLGGSRNAFTILKNSAAYGFGLRLLKDFDVAVDIRQVLVKKETALAKHASQMSRLVQDKNWPVLSDVADGEFLACFFKEFEAYRHYAIRDGEIK